VCTRGSNRALLRGPSTSPLDAMAEPPVVIDSSVVLFYAVVDASIRYTARGFVIVDGKVIDPVPRLAITRNLYDGDILVCRCDDDWNVLGVAAYTSLEEAQVRTENVYTGITAKWQAYRELTEEELAEIEEIRRDVQDS
jgi:hypothetical protein